MDKKGVGIGIQSFYYFLYLRVFVCNLAPFFFINWVIALVSLSFFLVYLPMCCCCSFCKTLRSL